MILKKTIKGFYVLNNLYFVFKLKSFCLNIIFLGLRSICANSGLHVAGAQYRHVSRARTRPRCES